MDAVILGTWEWCTSRVWWGPCHHWVTRHRLVLHSCNLVMCVQHVVIRPTEYILSGLCGLWSIQFTACTRTCCGQYGHVAQLTTSFYPNLTTLRSDLCKRKSVCNVGVPYSDGWTFWEYFSPLCTLAILWPPSKFKEIDPEEPLLWGR